ncbi:hypothetical protein HY483_00645 [Candidatus Woesearchaeota archaeon]|nr:hypothetical protein [Candidatus Woesearchaeota archaeon]
MNKVALAVFVVLLYYLASRYLRMWTLKQGVKKSYNSDINTVLNGEQFKVKGRFDE